MKFVAAVLLVGVTSAPAAEPPASSRAIPTAKASASFRIDLERIRAEQRVKSISVALIDGGAVGLAVAVGEAEARKPATRTTPYNIASLAKPLTAEVALRLAGRGRIALDENMSAHWTDPDIAQDPRRNSLTPAVALSHRTGFPNWRKDKLAFERDPGQAFGYSGEGYEYLAHFIAKKTGRPLDRWAGDLVFRPLGMRETTYTDKPWLHGRMALPHDPEGRALKPVVRKEPVASDDVYSTPTDYARFIAGILKAKGGTVPVGRFAVLADRRPDLCAKLPPSDCPTEAGMALGWESYLIAGKRYLMHTGSDEGTFTFAYFSPDSRSGAVIFTNSSHGGSVVLPVLRLAGRDAPFVDFLERLVKGPG